jgi:hypothetical protein
VGIVIKNKVIRALSDVHEATGSLDVTLLVGTNYERINRVYNDENSNLVMKSENSDLTIVYNTNYGDCMFFSNDRQILFIHEAKIKKPWNLTWICGFEVNWDNEQHQFYIC